MANSLASLDQSKVKVGYPGCANFPLFDNLCHCRPRIFDCCPRFVWPVTLVQIDSVNAQPGK